MTTRTRGRSGRRKRSVRGRGENESLVEFVTRRLKEDPPWDPDDTREINGKTMRRDVRTYRFGEHSIQIGGYEIYQRDLDNEPKRRAFREDLSTHEMKLLEAELTGRRVLTHEERIAERSRRSRRRQEIQVHGTPVETATGHQKGALALEKLQGNDPLTKRLRAAVFRELAADEEAEAAAAEGKKK